MAKGNPFLGQLRGSVGDVVFSRVKGQQVAKSRNRQPQNPRTGAQMANRSHFAGAGQFYSRANQAQFKFAFENKRSHENDYNAFMRFNAKLGIYLKPADIYDRTLPCVGPFMMTKGSIEQPSIAFETANGASAKSLLLSLGNFSGSSVADLTNYFMQTYNLQNGDILTMWVAKSDYSVVAGVISPADTPVQWLVSQIILDSNDSRTIEEATASQRAHIYLASGVTAGSKALVVGLSSATDFADDEKVIIGGACITRVVNGAVKASTSYAQMNDAAKSFHALKTSTAYIAEVNAAWQASGDALLKGALASPAQVASNGGLNNGGTSGVTLYTITYKHNGSVVTTQQYPEGATIVEPDAPASGWIWGNTPATMPARDVVVTSVEED